MVAQLVTRGNAYCAEPCLMGRQIRGSNPMGLGIIFLRFFRLEILQSGRL